MDPATAHIAADLGSHIINNVMMKKSTLLLFSILIMKKTHTQNYPDVFARAADTSGVLCMDTDGNNYATIKIGSQVWMAENLKTTTYNDGTPIPLVTDSATWCNLLAPGYCWYNNDANNRNAYGALYNWFTVNTGKLAPAGWHVPTDTDWTILTTFLGGEKMAGGKLKDASKNYWKNPNAGAENESGFTALPAGHRNNNGTFRVMNNDGYWWSVTEYGSTGKVWYRSVNYNYAGVLRVSDNKKNGYSIRCIQDAVSTAQPFITTTAVSDLSQTTASSGGNITNTGGVAITDRGVCWNTRKGPTIANSKISYGTGTGSFISSLTGLTAHTTYYARAFASTNAGTVYGNEIHFTTLQFVTTEVTLCSQVWMAKNLDLTHYRNGDSIPHVTDSSSWAALTTGAWCYYNNDPSTNAAYGKLYNWYAVNDPRGLAPLGWHVPSDDEWTTLEICLAGSPVAVGKTKVSDTKNPAKPNTGTIKNIRLTGFPDSRWFAGLPDSRWWSSELSSPYLDFGDIGPDRESTIKQDRYSVRCLRD